MGIIFGIQAGTVAENGNGCGNVCKITCSKKASPRFFPALHLHCKQRPWALAARLPRTQFPFAIQCINQRFHKPDEQSQTCLSFAMARAFVQVRAEAKLAWIMPSAAESLKENGAIDKPCGESVRRLTQKHVAKRYMIAEKLLSLHHESYQQYKYV